MATLGSRDGLCNGLILIPCETAVKCFCRKSLVFFFLVDVVRGGRENVIKDAMLFGNCRLPQSLKQGMWSN